MWGYSSIRWMYSMEKYFKVLKSVVKNMAKLEGSISEATGCLKA